MVGGIIIETRTIHSRKVWVNVEERPRNGAHKPGTCAVYVDPTMLIGEGRYKLQRGDALWWQGQYAMWTPKNEKGETIDPELTDIKMLRIGYSGVSKPEHRG